MDTDKRNTDARDESTACSNPGILSLRFLIPGALACVYDLSMALQWMHVQWSTFGTWLPGDPRGFRNHKHRIHSSGDYTHPPPKGEHAGLRHYAQRVMRQDAVTLSPVLRERLRDEIVCKAVHLGLDPRAMAVCFNHVHLLARFDAGRLGRTVGQLKRASSVRVADVRPGTVWAARCHHVCVNDREQYERVFGYILAHERREGAAVWRKPPKRRVP